VSRRRRLLLWALGLSAAALLAIVLVLAGLLASERGSTLLLNRVVAMLPAEALSWQRLQGSVADGLVIEGLRYRADGLALDIDRIELDLALRPLVGGRLQLQRVGAQGLRLQLPAAVEAEPERGVFDLQLPDALPAIALPLPIDIASLQLRGLRVVDAADALLFEAQALNLAGAIDAGRIELAALELDSPMLQLSARGSIDTAAEWRSDLSLDGQWRAGLETAQAFIFSVEGSLSAARLRLRLPDAEDVQLDIDLAGGLPQPDWTLRLVLPNVPAALQPLWPAGVGALSLDGQGDLGQAALSGQVSIDGVDWKLDEAQLGYAGSRLQVDHLRIGQGGGQAELSGWLELGGDEPALEVAAQFDALELPAAEGAPLRIDGELQAQGPLSALQLQPALALQRAELTGRVEGQVLLSATAAELTELSVSSGVGRLLANGRIEWEDVLSWDIRAQLQAFDPGLLAPAWPGVLSAELDSRGRYSEAATDGSLNVQGLQGELQGRPLQGEIALAWTAVDRGQLQSTLRWGASDLRADLQLEGMLGGYIDLQPLDLASLDAQASGQVRGRLDLAGSLDAPELQFALEGGPLSFAELSLETLIMSGALGRGANAPLRMRVRGSGVRNAGAAVGDIGLDLRGDVQAHALDIAVQTAEGGVTVELSGGWRAADARWLGRLQQLQFVSSRPRSPTGDWALVEPVALSVDAARLRLDPLCLQGQRTRRGAAGEADLLGRLCVEADWGQDRAGRIAIELDGLPLALPGALLGNARDAAMPWRWQGDLQGRIEASGDGERWQLSGSLQAPAGALTVMDPDLRTLLAWREVRVDIEGSPERLELLMTGSLGEAGRIDGQLSLERPLQADGALAGQLVLDLDSLRALELVSAGALLAPSGRLNADFLIAGTRDSPLLSGGLRVADFAAELPALGIRPSAGFLQLDLLSAQTAALSFGLTSGGELRGSGRLDWSAQAESLLQLSIEGRDVLVSDTPQLQLEASPELTIEQRGDLLRLRGRVEVPRAEVRLDRFEGSAQVSADVVVLDPAETRAENAAAQLLDTDLRLVLGDDVRLQGFGLTGTVTGELRVRDRPGRATSGSGSLNVSGRYKAYGQDLDISRGRLAFAQSPLDNPALDIRAERQLEQVKVGIRVTGTGAAPQLGLWSEPALDQADVLSYLVLGRPMRAARGGEGEQLNAAAAALGAGGNLLAERLGARLGLDQAGVEESAALGGAALTVGKYLSPRLYISYGVALFGDGQVFSVKYLLSEIWNVQLDTSERENRASVNYRLER
jgi:translocation and assembly module TamB